MQAILLTVLFGFAANLDNVGIGMAYGARRRPIRLRANLLIALITTTITLCALAGGIVLRRGLPERLPNLLGGSLLIAIAGLTFWADRVGGTSIGLPRSVSLFAGPVGLAEAVLLSLILSINNVGLAFAGGLAGIGYQAAAIAVFVLSVILLAFGQRISHNLLRLPQQLSRLINGHALLALVGVLMLVGY